MKKEREEKIKKKASKILTNNNNTKFNSIKITYEVISHMKFPIFITDKFPHLLIKKLYFTGKRDLHLFVFIDMYVAAIIY